MEAISSSSPPRTPGAGAPTPSQSATIAALLTQPSTTITAYQVQSTTGLLIIDSTTLTWRGDALTLDNGDVVSAGFNGLEDRTTTADFRAVTLKGTGSSQGSSSSGTATSDSASTRTSDGGAAAPVGTGIGAGKTVALLGAVAGMMAYGF